MDAALVINGIVDTVYRNAVAAEMPEHETGIWIASPAGEVFGGFLYEGNGFTEPEAAQAAPPPPVPSIVASGGYTVVNGEIDTLNVVAGITAAFAIDTGTYWLFFTEPQPDLSYVVIPGCSEGRINTTSRTTDFFELCVKDDGGALINPTEFSVNVVRTQ